MDDKAAREPEPRKADDLQQGNAGTPGIINKSEAVRQAMAAGFEDPREGTAYILKVFGIELSLSHFSAIRVTERKKGWMNKGKPGRKPTKGSRQPAGGGLTLGGHSDDETDPIEPEEGPPPNREADLVEGRFSQEN
jgi:hypothetical protein